MTEDMNAASVLEGAIFVQAVFRMHNHLKRGEGRCLLSLDELHRGIKKLFEDGHDTTIPKRKGGRRKRPVDCTLSSGSAGGGRSVPDALGGIGYPPPRIPTPSRGQSSL